MNGMSHHIITRGAGGCDCADNLIPLCVKHHSEVGNIGCESFFEKYGIYDILERAREHKYAHKRGEL